MEELNEGPKTWFHEFAEGPVRHVLHIPNNLAADYIVVTWIVCLVLILLAFLVGRSLQRVPGRMQNLAEIFALIGDRFVRETTQDEGGARYTPFILTLFFFILVGSFIGIIPGFTSPTANLNTTVALAIIAFVYVHIAAIRKVGIVTFVKAFFPPPVWLTWFLGPIEIISHLIRPLTLSIRLFGNIFGEDAVIVVLAFFGLSAFEHWYLPLPVQLPMMLFSLFTDLVQAAVFVMLTTIYIQLLTISSHGDHVEPGGSGEHPAAH